MDDLEPGEVVRDANNPNHYAVVAPPTIFNVNSLVHRPQPNVEVPPPKHKGKYSSSVPQGWVRIDRLQLPFVMRGGVSFISVRLIEEKILAKYPSDYPEALKNRAPLKSFYLTTDEVKRLNDFTTDGFNFTEKDLIVSLEDFQAFYSLVKLAFPLGINYITGGWLQVNNSVVPYVNRASAKMMPLCVLKYASRLLLDDGIEGEEPLPAECMYLNAISIKGGITFTFDRMTTLVSVTTLHAEEKGTVVVKELPLENPFGKAVYCHDEEEKKMKEEAVKREEEERREEEEKRREIMKCFTEEKRRLEEEERVRKEEKRLEEVRIEEMRREEIRRECLRIEGLRQAEARKEQQRVEELLQAEILRREESEKEEQRRAEEEQRRLEAVLPPPPPPPPAATTTNQPKLNIQIKPKEYRGKTISCYVKDNQYYVLLEALSTVYFKGGSVRHFVSYIERNIGEKVITLTPAEEGAFIAFYNLPTNKLKHNKVLCLKDFDPVFDSLSEFMDKIGQKKRPLAAANHPQTKMMRQ